MAVVIGVVLAATGIICIMLANHQYWELGAEINEQLPEDKKFDPVFWTASTWLNFRELRKQVLPDSPRPKRAIIFAAIGFCCFFSGVFLFFSQVNL